MTSNFIFLLENYNLLYNIAYLAEKKLYSDPNTCIFKLRQFSEVMMSEIFQIEHIPIPEEHNQAAKINTLKRAEQRPEDYIKAFRTFIIENQNRIAALNILCTRPKELTRSELKSLRLEMEQAGYSIKEINHAWNKAKNVDITTDIIGIVRTLALGNALVDYALHLENAFKKLKTHCQFTKIEEKWLDRIEKYLVKEQFIDHESFNTGAFKNEGSYEKINKAFKNQLDEIVDELKEYLFETA